LSVDRVPLAEPLLRAEDVAALLQIPRSSLYELSRRRHDPIPRLHLGRSVRFERCEVEAWLARQRFNADERRPR
jgi:excisionase family DNA binding protein